MAYEKQNFLDGQIVTADHLNHMENGIIAAQNPRNLLDNSDFTNPVNQRGATSYSGYSYSVDRWYGSALYQTVSIQNNYITISATGTSYVGIRQKVQNMAKLAGKTVTFVAQIYSSVGTRIAFLDGSGNTIAKSDGAAGQNQILILTYTVPSGSTMENVIPAITCKTQAKGDSANIYWAALYEGAYDASTLPPYVPKGYAAELSECQRYYFEVPAGGAIISRTRNQSANVYAAYEICPPIVFPKRMRIVPTVTLYYDIMDGEGKSGGPLSCTAGSCTMPNVAVPINGWFDLNKVVASADL